MNGIRYNNESVSNLITLTDVPNILTIYGKEGGTYAEVYIMIQSTLKGATTQDNQWWFEIMGETVTNVITPSNAINKNFYISDSVLSTIASLTKAIRNCPTVAANFSIENTTRNGTPCVKLKARNIGSFWTSFNDFFKTNIGSTYYSTYVIAGSANSSLVGAKIDVDVYSDGDYVTTLEKNFYGTETSFNLSPVLTTFAEYGKLKPYTLNVSSIMSNGEYSAVGSIDTNYISVGYMVNQGLKFIPNGLSYAQNFSRGKEREFANNTLLYLYENKVDLSLFTGNSGGYTLKIDYLDSAFKKITPTRERSLRCYPNSIDDLSIVLNDSGNAYFPLAFYIDITIGGLPPVRYNVIKPIKATEYYQRILWRNSYGGISFFDFTGQKTETRDVEISTYEKNIFGYYTDDMNELEKVYNNEVKYTVTLKSHLFENDGKYIFNDLLQSANVWTEINGEKYAIIIDSVSVDETDQNNIYEATVKYHYSQEPSLI